MKLSQIQMTGFKSFRNTTTISFGEGVTGIVGPNGCGKSNIVDALLWVTGEGSASQLRGSQMEDVIFSGSSACPPSAFAEVSLTFEKDEGEWPERFQSSELTLCRKVSRGGDSKYFINGESCLLRDIQEIIMDTGAMGFSVVEQGAIARITTSKPEQLKTLIEQAAGTAKFKNKKRLAQNKLKDTCQNMLRLSDVLREHTRQLKKLEKQAQQTHTYKELKEKITRAELYVLHRRYNEVAQNIKTHTELLKELSVREEELQTNLSSLQKKSKEALSQSEKKYSHLKKEREILREHLETRGQREVKVEKLKSLVESELEKLDEWRMNIVEYQSAVKHKSQEIEKLKNQESVYKNKIAVLTEDLERKTAQLEEKNLQYSLIQKSQTENKSFQTAQIKKELQEEEYLKSFKKEMDNAAQNIKNLQQELQEKEQIWLTLENKISNLLDKISPDQAQLKEEAFLLKEYVHQWTKKERQVYSEKMKVFENRLEETRSLKTQSENRCLKLKEESSILQQKAFSEEEKYKKFIESRDKLKTSVDQTRFSLISLQKDLKACCYQADLLEKSIDEMSQKILNLSKRSERCKEELHKNQEDLSQAKSLWEAGKKEYEKKAKASEVYEKDYQSQVSLYKELENQISELSQDAAQVSERKHSAEVEQEALMGEKKNLEEKTVENYQVSISSFQEDRPPEQDIKSLSLMKERLSKIGQVNLLALSEYEELDDEQKVLQKQFDDLELSKKELEQTIEEMDRISTQKFKKTYNEVNARLAQVFQAVFNGGEAGLCLVENEGVEILACPPGKKLKSLKLLSGGEKSLTALCVIFSLFLVRTSPFCVLDEVDAALDDSNIFRFNTLVTEIAQRCQVILITHNKHSMKVCHRLYGVTMEEKGVTKLVSVEMKDYSSSLSV